VEDFGAVDKVAWLAVAFMTPSLAFMLSNGQLFQTFNIKWMYIAGVVIFEAGSALCGAAPSMTILILGRVIGGIGSTFIYTGSIVLITVNTNESERFGSCKAGNDFSDRYIWGWLERPGALGQ
jgi:MFS family permease